jgi:hypothetical protein
MEIDYPRTGAKFPGRTETLGFTHMASSKKSAKKKARASFADIKPRKNPKGGIAVGRHNITVDFRGLKLT